MSVSLSSGSSDVSSSGGIISTFSTISVEEIISSVKYLIFNPWVYHLTNINTHDKYVRISKLKIIFEENFIFFGIVGDSIFCFLLNISFKPPIL